MELRRELLPPTLDETLVSRLAELASSIDGANPGQWENELTEFNQLADMAITFEEFQGIYGGQSHSDWVRRLLFARAALALPDIGVEDMTEVVTRIRLGGPDSVFYQEVFAAKCRHSAGSDLIHWPGLVPDLPQGREPSASEIAALAVAGH